MTSENPAVIQVTDAQFAELFDRRDAVVLECGHWLWDIGTYYGLGSQVVCLSCGDQKRPTIVVGVGQMVTHKRTGASRG